MADADDETPEALLARVEAEQGADAADVVRRFLAAPPAPPRRNVWARRTSEGKRVRVGRGVSVVGGRARRVRSSWC